MIVAAAVVLSVVAAATSAANPASIAGDGSAAPPATPATPTNVGPTRPNIVFMLSDDQHWSGLSVPMHPNVPGSRGANFHTPHLEQMAADGMRFSSAYAPAPVCAPTRASLLTGRSPAALGWGRAGQSGRTSSNRPLLSPRGVDDLSGQDLTIGHVLRAAGYTTAHFGKWHVGGGGPAAHGFDVSDGNIGNEAAGKFRDPNPVDIFGMADRAEAFMAAAVLEDRPFFVQLSWLALHAPENARASTRERYTDLSRRDANRAALTEDLDAGVGRVLAMLDALGVRENTYVVYMSDNGGHPDGGPLSGGKGTLSEGGIRVPMIVRGPDIAPGRWAHVPVVGHDLYPTFAAWAGATIPAATRARLEGGSLAGVLEGAATAVDRPGGDELIFHYPQYHTGDRTAGGPQSAIRRGRYKLIRYAESGRVVLYDLETDLGESRDLSVARPALAAELEAVLDARLAIIGANLARPNPAYDPDQPASAPGRRAGQAERNRRTDRTDRPGRTNRRERGGADAPAGRRGGQSN